jgi:putative transcriptional regulator
MKSNKYQSEILGSIHRTVEGLHRVGAVDVTTMREFDETCLTQVEDFGPDAVRALREREGASQAVLAKHLGVATATVGQWERGQRHPEGPAAKLLSLVKAHGLAHIR